MTELFVVSNGAMALAKDVTVKQVNAKADLFIKDVKEMGKRCDEITIAHALIISGQDHWKQDGKGDTSSMAAWLLTLQDNNKSWYESAVSFAKKVLGLDFKVVRDEEDKVECVVTLAKGRNGGELRSLLGARLVGAWETGISYDSTGTYAKLKAPKAKAVGAGSGANTDPSNVIEVSPASAKAEAIGLTAAMQDLTDEQEQSLKELMPLIAQILEHVKDNPNKAAVKELLESTVTKLNKGFSLSSVMADKIPA